jgi:hypothetical protein
LLTWAAHNFGSPPNSLAVLDGCPAERGERAERQLFSLRKSQLRFSPRDRSRRFIPGRPSIDVERLAGRLARSTGQVLTRHGKSDHETFRLPIARDFSSKLAGHRRANKKVAESFIANGRDDRWSAPLCPGNDDGSSTISAVNLDLPGSRGKRAIFHGICREFVQQQREARDRNQRSKAADSPPRLGEAR